VSRPYRLALPSKGRLHHPALELARDAGIDTGGSGRALASHCARWDIEVLFARSSDIPVWLADGAVDAAIAGRNDLVEHGSTAHEVAALGFGRCTLSLAVPDQAPIDRVEQLDGRRVATSYPRTTAGHLAAAGVRAEITTLGGSVELAPRLQAADAVCDLVSSGDTLRANGLRTIGAVLESEAVLAARRPAAPGHERVTVELATVMTSVVAARDRRYLMLNAPDEALPRIVELLPGMDSPTVLPLARGGMHAVHAVVSRSQAVSLLEPLRAAGARSLLVLPIENLIA
jgi:ATP phosphoribosyltransferase